MKALEAYVHLRNSGHPLPASFSWQCLVMLWASMRCDDALHTPPSSVDLREDRLHAATWQKKVDKIRRGTRYVVPRFSLGDDWLLSRHGAWRSVVTQEYLDSDHWLHDVGNFTSFSPMLLSCDDFVTSMRWVFSEAEPMDERNPR